MQYTFFVFIHRSIKTRIETIPLEFSQTGIETFLYIDPLKQGLKPEKEKKEYEDLVRFLYIDPLKQGLKQLYFRKLPPTS